MRSLTPWISLGRLVAGSRPDNLPRCRRTSCPGVPPDPRPTMLWLAGMIMLPPSPSSAAPVGMIVVFWLLLPVPPGGMPPGPPPPRPPPVQTGCAAGPGGTDALGPRGPPVSGPVLGPAVIGCTLHGTDGCPPVPPPVLGPAGPPVLGPCGPVVPPDAGRFGNRFAPGFGVIGRVVVGGGGTTSRGPLGPPVVGPLGGCPVGVPGGVTGGCDGGCPGGSPVGGEPGGTLGGCEVVGGVISGDSAYQRHR